MTLKNGAKFLQVMVGVSDLSGDGLLYKHFYTCYQDTYHLSGPRFWKVAILVMHIKATMGVALDTWRHNAF